jgi:hypothetical protein
LFWFIEVVENIVHCVAAGAVGEWWFGLHDATTVQRSRIRAATFSLGSLVVATLTPHWSGCCVASSAVHSIVINTHAEQMAPDVAPAHHKRVEILIRDSWITACKTLTHDQSADVEYAGDECVVDDGAPAAVAKNAHCIVAGRLEVLAVDGHEWATRGILLSLKSVPSASS